MLCATFGTSLLLRAQKRTRYRIHCIHFFTLFYQYDSCNSFGGEPWKLGYTNLRLATIGKSSTGPQFSRMTVSSSWRALLKRRGLLQTEPLNYSAQTRLQLVNNRRWKTPPISCGSCGKQAERLTLHMNLPALLKFPRRNYADDLSALFSRTTQVLHTNPERAYLL